MIQDDANIVLGALDSLGVALADHHHQWSVGEREIFEQAVEIMAASTNDCVETSLPASETPCSASACECKKCKNYQKYLAWKKRENASDGVNELVEENRHLKDQLATLSITHAKACQRLDELLSNYVRDKRIIGEALSLTGENVMIHWFQLQAIQSLQNS